MYKQLKRNKRAWNRNKKARAVKKSIFTGGRLVVAGIVAAAISIWNTGKQVFDGATNFAENKFHKQNEVKGDKKMKKSTFLTVLVVLAAIAGALGALYFYVLRREKELDEYEQLLFSEDFNDEVPADFMNDEDDFATTPAADDDSAKKAKA